MATNTTGHRSSSLTDVRTPIVDNFLSILPSGHEKALKYAFYNVLALVSSAFIILACWTVYCILEPFIKPLLWAVLCGTVLHPFKANLSQFVRTWLKNAKSSPTPFTIQVLAVPFRIADNSSEKIGGYVWTYWKSITGVLLGFFATYIIYYHPPMTLVYIGQSLVSIIFRTILWILSWINWPMIITMNTVYLGYIAYFIIQKQSTDITSTPRSNAILSPKTPVLSEVKEDEDETDILNSQSPKQDLNTPEVISTNISSSEELSSNFLHLMSYSTAIVTFSFLILRLPYTVLLSIIAILGFGFVSFLRDPAGDDRANNKPEPVFSKYAKSILIWSSKMTGTPVSSSGDAVDDGSKSAGLKHITDRFKLQRSWSEGAGRFQPTLVRKNVDIGGGADASEVGSSVELESQILDSNTFLYGVLCAVLFVQVWNHLWILHLLPIPVVYYGLKKLARNFGFIDLVKRKINQPVIEFYADMRDDNSKSLFPLPLRIFFKIICAGDRKLISLCEEYLDPAISAVVLIIVLMCTILGLIFSLTQVYGEGDHLVRVGVNLVNSTVSQYPEINEILPEGWQTIMDSMSQNAYVYGKEYITNTIRDTVAEKNPVKAQQIEQQVIELWDRIYLAWNQTWDTSNLKKPEGLSPIEWNELLEQGKAMPDLLDLSASYAKANVGTIWTILESLYHILVGNISLVFSTLTSLCSVLFGGGTAIMNLLLNMVVFMTALFYLLSLSTSNEYKPKELFNHWTLGSRHSQNFAIAVEEAVNGVFTASFKMAAFYGMWTWLTHTLFQVNMVFLPSIFAAIFGAVPFITHYFAAFPAVLELWLIQGHLPKALFMMLVQIAPMSIVDTQIYSEIKGGGHPYLTGLAVAGGIFYFGFQGALIGPIVLCLFFVAFKIGGSFLRDEELDGRTSFAKRLGAVEQ